MQQFCEREIDPVQIDREARIPDRVIRGLGELGVLGACLPPRVGGLGLSQTDYCRILEVIGSHCASTALFVNAHHSIGPRALVLFGTPAQQEQWLPKLVTGEWISAFALTEPQAGSDAGNVQTTAMPTADGTGFILNGEKRWITNGGIADAVIVMARTPHGEGSRVTAFQIARHTPGFEVIEERMEKMGVRGTATSRLRFNEMFVGRDAILGEEGQGLRVALTVLDYGRTTFGATCTGVAKDCLKRTIEHVKSRVQFGRPLAEFEFVQEKVASMAAMTYAMEATTFQTAAVIDAGAEEYMLETAMLKVFATEALWKILDDGFQLQGGKAYFCDEPFERMVRDARINTIGEGANDVLRAFIALVGIRDVGLSLEALLDAVRNPLRNLGALSRALGDRAERLFTTPDVGVRSGELESDAHQLGKLVADFGGAVEWLLRKYREQILDCQCQLGRISNASMNLYACGAVLNRLDQSLATTNGEMPTLELATARHFFRLAKRHIDRDLAGIKDNDDELLRQYARRLLAS